MKRYCGFSIVDASCGCLLAAGRRFKDESALIKDYVYDGDKFNNLSPYRGRLYHRRIYINGKPCVVFLITVNHKPDYKDFGWVTRYGKAIGVRGSGYAANAFPNSYMYLQLMRSVGLKAG